MNGHQPIFMKKASYCRFISLSLTAIAICICFIACFKDLPQRTTVYSNNFESKTGLGIEVYNAAGLVDTPTITSFNGTQVLGRFNNNLVSLKVKNLPVHSILKITFDLYIHDQWDGDYIAPGNSLPDAWVMNLDNFPLYLTTFSNGIYRQSFPANYTAGGFMNPPKANAWAGNLPAACTSPGNTNGTTLYKIENITSHTADSLVITMNDVLQPPGNYCLKSWSIDNMVITVNRYQ